MFAVVICHHSKKHYIAIKFTKISLGLGLSEREIGSILRTRANQLGLEPNNSQTFSMGAR
jgi:hypothetical protein